MMIINCLGLTNNKLKIKIESSKTKIESNKTQKLNLMTVK